MWYVYVLRSMKDGRLYAGTVSDLRKRLDEHNRGKEPGTKNMAPFELAYYEACQSKKDAFKREKYLKTAYGKRYLKAGLQDYLAGYSTGRSEE
jgi:putative endonuclease